jgi:hypothetical protein
VSRGLDAGDKVPRNTGIGRRGGVEGGLRLLVQLVGLGLVIDGLA